VYSSDIYQAGATPGIRSYRCSQGAPDQPYSLLLYEDEESAKSSQFTAHQLTLTMLAGSGIARCEEGLHHHTDR